MYAPYLLHDYLLAAVAGSVADEPTDFAPAAAGTESPCAPGCPPPGGHRPPPSPWEKFKAWFWDKQRGWNDWLLVPLIGYVFLSFPSWLRRQTDEPVLSFPSSYLTVPVFGVLLAVWSFAFAWNFLHVQFPDEYKTIRHFRTRHNQLLRELRACPDPVQSTRLEFQIYDSWRSLRYSLFLLLSFFLAALLASVAALVVA